MTLPMRRVAFWLLLAAVAVAHIIVAAQSLLVLRMWEDEAFNLTVVLNLLGGHGYASDGALSGSMITPFDPRISTGPVVLLPAAVFVGLGFDPVIGARLVPLLYWMLLLAGLGILGHRISGRWGALIAVAVPLMLDVSGQSPIQGPADFLGEIPAAALLVWALVVLPRRAWLAGLLVGLAVQAKLIALLALPAFAIAVWALAPGTGWSRIGSTFRRGWLPLVLAGVPTLILELAAFISLGVDGFVEHLRGIVSFLRSGGQNDDPTTVLGKLTWLIDSWYMPGWLVVLVVIAGVGAIIAALVFGRRLKQGNVALLLASAVGVLVYLTWWSTASHTPLWTRHPSPGLLAFVPILAAFALWGVCEIWHTRRSPADARDPDTRRAPAILAASAAVVIAASGVIGGAQHAVMGLTPPTTQTLQEQRDTAATVAEWVDRTETEWLAALPWGGSVSIIVLSGAHVGLHDAPAMDGVPRLTLRECSVETLVESSPYRVCAAR